LAAVILAGVVVVAVGAWLINRPTENEEVPAVPGAQEKVQKPVESPVPLAVGPPRSPRPGASTIEAHTRRVYAVAFSPDAKLLATGGEDNFLRVWDVATAKLHKRLHPGAEVCCLAFAPGGKVLASGGADRAVTLWDVETWEKKGTIADGSPAAVAWLAFAPDGRTLVTVGHKQKVAVLWDVSTGKRVASLDGHTDRVHAAAFSPDSQTVATVSDDRTVRLWDAATGRAKADPLKAHDQPVTCLAFSPDGTKLATGSEDQTIAVWDVAAGKVIGPELDAGGPVVLVGWTPDGRIISKTFRDGVSLWNPAVNRPEIVREPFDKPIAGVSSPYKAHPALTSDGRVLAFRHCHPYSSGEVHLIDLSKFIDEPK
jgi:WD40 repeat protein